jgi:hypothetical protein
MRQKMLVVAVAALACGALIAPTVASASSPGSNQAVPSVQLPSQAGDALRRAQAQIQGVLDRLDGIVSRVPPAAQPYVQQATNRVRQQLTAVLDRINDLLNEGPVAFARH